MAVKIDAMNVLLWTGFFVAVAAIKQSRRKNQIQNIINQLVKRYPGYTITNCKLINIESLEKAYKGAYEVGKNVKDGKELYVKLFGTETCIDTIQFTGVTSEFTHNLIAHGLAGGISTGAFKLEGSIVFLNELKEDFEKLGYSTKNWVPDSKQYLQLILQEMQ